MKNKSNKYKIIVITLLIILSITGYLICKSPDYPEELDEVIQNTNNEFWALHVSPYSLYLLNWQQGYYHFYQISFLEKDIVKRFNNSTTIEDYKKLIYKVGIIDSRHTNRIKSWRRTEESSFGEPLINETIPYTAYNIKDYYNSNTNKPVVSLNKIFNYQKMETPIFNNWTNYEATYDLSGAQGGLPFPKETYEGKVFIALNENHNEMKEIYISNNDWVIIRHVEEGEFPIDINEDDLDSILESVWWGWKNIIQPMKIQLEQQNIVQ
ncbi:MAG: hypothetical protein ACOC2J_01780 [bacterium]